MPLEDRRCISPYAFAEAMLERDSGFAERVRAFEEEFGELDPDLTAVLAQAAYLCAYRADIRANLVAGCRASGGGAPTRRLGHCQVTRERWLALHAYVVGLRQWLGDLRPAPGCLDLGVVESVQGWLGEDAPGKRALAELCLCRLLDAMHSVCVSAIASTDDPRETPESELDSWRCLGDEPFAPAMVGHWLKDRKETARTELRERLAGVDELIDGILADSPPPCHHRFIRYVRIWITSVGALEWRGALPPPESDGEDVRDWREFWDGEVRPFLTEGWPAGRMPRTEYTWELHKALGPPISIRRAIVAQFLMQPPPNGADVDKGWLRERQAP